jgi:GNAT superfamily N-acetyltransferase
MTASPVTVRMLDGPAAHAAVPSLAAVLMDCVEGGASVSFLSPLNVARAEAFWRAVADGVAAGERILLAAEDGAGTMLGTVQLVTAQPENQPHRADLAKMLVRRDARRRGTGGVLMRAAEAAALAAGKTLLVLDTASADAERLYQRAGWTRVGTVPGYALLPGGAYCDTIYFYKWLTDPPG